MVARLLEQYKKEIVPAMVKQFGYGNVMAVPRLEKIVISMGMGDAHAEKAKLETVTKELTLLAGQKPVVTTAKKSISNFKLREGMNVGLKVTLRRERMYEFLDRLISLAIPRVKDFRGLSPKAFDGGGNFNMGLVEQTVFPEINAANIAQTQGMNINMQTSAQTDDEARALLGMLGMPFKNEND